MLTSKEGNGAGQESSEADIQAPVHQAGGQSIGDAVLYHGALNHIQHRHCVHLQQDTATGLCAAPLCSEPCCLLPALLY